MPAHKQQPMACFVSGVTCRILATFERMADFVIRKRLRYIKRIVPSLVGAQREVEIFGTKRAKLLVEASQLLKQVAAHHHRPATGNTLRLLVILPLVNLS